MRFAVISDIHGNLAAANAVFADIDALEHPVDVTVCAGDVVGHAAHPNEVIGLLKQRKVDTVRGNYDEVVSGTRTSTGADYTSEYEQDVDEAAVRWTQGELDPENVEFLRNLPREARIQVSPSGRTAVRARKTDDAVGEYRRGFLLGSFLGGLALGPPKRREIQARRVLVVHGSPRDTVEYLYPTTARSTMETIARNADSNVIIFGHTHRSFQQIVGEVAFIGVGSVGRPRGGPVAEYSVIEILGPEIEVEPRLVEYDVEAEASDIESSGLPSLLADKLRHDAKDAEMLGRGA